jgi:membrane dipeptidase
MTDPSAAGRPTAAAGLTLLSCILILVVEAGSGETSAKPPVVPVFDLHCDTLYQSSVKGTELAASDGGVDIKKMRQGGYLAQVFAMWVPPGKGWASVEKMAATFWRWMSELNGDIVLATDGTQVLKAKVSGRMAAVLGIEGLAPLNGDLGKIRTLHAFGVRVIGLTWFNGNAFAGSSNSKDKQGTYGLTEKGRQAVKLAQALGMVIDVSHASDQAVRDVAAISTQPFIASHSCARKLNDIERNLSDELLALIGEHGGVVGLNFHRSFLSAGPGEQVTMEDVVDQITAMVKVAGIDAVGVGSDFDGAHPPDDLAGADKMQDLAEALRKRGWSELDVKKVMGLNALRVYTRVTEGRALGDLLAAIKPYGFMPGWAGF